MAFLACSWACQSSAVFPLQSSPTFKIKWSQSESSQFWFIHYIQLVRVTCTFRRGASRSRYHVATPYEKGSRMREEQYVASHSQSLTLLQQSKKFLEILPAKALSDIKPHLASRLAGFWCSGPKFYERFSLREHDIDLNSRAVGQLLNYIINLTLLNHDRAMREIRMPWKFSAPSTFFTLRAMPMFMRTLPDFSRSMAHHNI